MEETKKSDQRLRVCFKSTAKGEIQPDVTAEAADPEIVKGLLSEGLKILKAETEAQGFTWMGNK